MKIMTFAGFWSVPVLLGLLCSPLRGQVNLEKEGSWPDFPRGLAENVAVSGQYAYVVYGDAGLKVIDLSVPGEPKVEGVLDTSGNAMDVAVSGQRAYVAGNRGGLQVIDISDPANPRPITSLTSVTPETVVLNGNYAYVTDWKAGLVVIDISSPAEPKKLGAFTLP